MVTDSVDCNVFEWVLEVERVIPSYIPASVCVCTSLFECGLRIKAIVVHEEKYVSCTFVFNPNHSPSRVPSPLFPPR